MRVLLCPFVSSESLCVAPVVYIVFVHVMAWAGALMLPECRGCGASIGRVGALSGRVLVAEVCCRVCVVLRRL